MLATGARDSGKDFDTLDVAANANPSGIWSDGETMWVADSVADRIFAYRMSNESFTQDEQFLTLSAAGNARPSGLWSDDETMWVADSDDGKLYAYSMSSRQRKPERDFNALRAAGNANPWGIWSNGITMWVADSRDAKIYAYRMSDRTHDPDKEFNTLSAVGNLGPRGLWSDGETIWVQNNTSFRVRLFSYILVVPGALDLSGLSLNGEPVSDFDADKLSYTISGTVALNADVTLTATTNDAGATVRSTHEDVLADTTGHQLALDEGANTIRLTVEKTGHPTDKTYELHVNAGDAPNDETSKAAIPVDEDGGPAYHFRGSIADSDDVDWVNVTLAADQLYAIILKGRHFGETDRTLDTPFLGGVLAMGVFQDGTDALGTFVSSGIDGRARALFMPATAGNYQLVVAGALDEHTGTYDLRVRPYTDDHFPDGVDTTSTISFPATTTDAEAPYPSAHETGTIDYELDHDWFRMSGLVRFSKYVIEARRGHKHHPRTGRRYLRVEVYDAAGNLLDVEDQGNLIVFQPLSAGDYYFRVYAGYRQSRSRYSLYVHPELSLGADAQSGGTLTLTPADIYDPDGTTRATRNDWWHYTWYRTDGTGNFVRISGEDESSYQPSSGDSGRDIFGRVCYKPDGSVIARECRDSQTVRVSSISTMSSQQQLANSPATGQVTIDGLAQVGQTLAANSVISDADGISQALYAYQWLADGDEITGATANTYTLTAAEQGRRITARIRFTDDAGNEETLTSDPTSAVAARPNTPATGQPTISGTAQVGETLTAGLTGIGDADGLQDVSYRYQWLTGGTEINGATGASYSLTAGELDQAIRLRVSFNDDAGNAETLTSAPTAAVAPEPNSPATGQPQIKGSALVGARLRVDTSGIADANGLTGAQYHYQWLTSDDGVDTEIAGATRPSYQLTSQQDGKSIKVRVSFTDDASHHESLISPALHPTRPTGLTATVSGETAVLSWDAPTGFPQLLDYQILREAPELGENEPRVTINTRSQATNYTDSGVQPGVLYRYRVKAANWSNLLSAASEGVEIRMPQAESDTEAQEPPATEPPAPSDLTYEINDDGHVVLSWTAPDDDSVTGYQILRRRPRENEPVLKIKVADTGSTTTRWTDTDAPASTLYVYRVKAINAAGAGPWSNYVNVDH